MCNGLVLIISFLIASYVYKDGLVLFLTVFRTYQAYWKTKVFHKHPIWDVIYKDGTIPVDCLVYPN